MKEMMDDEFSKSYILKFNSLTCTDPSSMIKDNIIISMKQAGGWNGNFIPPNLGPIWMAHDGAMAPNNNR